jgi:release factor glutamine methyltransferase
MVEPPILIPRPETEEWVTWLIGELQPVAQHKITILDLCTGSGCIALALAHALPLAHVVGIDKNPAACSLAQKNKCHNKLTNVHFIESDLFSALKQNASFDIIVSNPPYITASEYTQLQPEVVQWEDKHALIAEENGLFFYQRIAHDAKKILNPASVLNQEKLPRVVVEIGNESQKIMHIFEHMGYKNIQNHKDMQGAIRWISAYV